MALESKSTIQETDPAKAGLVYDADSITLSGGFLDEVSAYRARRRWSEVLSQSFLLEHDKDYEMSVSPGADKSWTLTCIFHSACGRYAFWRLVNHQAPDAEQKLYTQNMLSRKSERFLLGSLWNSGSQHPAPWIYTGLDGVNRRKPNLFQSFVDCLQRALR